MKKLIAIFLVFAIALTGCSVQETANNSISNSTTAETTEASESQADTAEETPQNFV